MGDISICIPTYNRAEFLPDLLDSISVQADDDIEVVISDNASTDDTEAVIDIYRPRIRNLVYSRAPENQGHDRNYLRAASMAGNRYLWFMGSDDAVEPDAIANIRGALSRHPGVAGMSIAARGFDYHLKHPIYFNDIIASNVPAETILRGPDEVSASIGTSFGYLSVILVDRILWAQSVHNNPVERYFNAFVHVFVILNVLRQNPLWLCYPRPLVRWRSGNDSFLVFGQQKRMETDVKGMDAVFGDVLGRSSPAYRAVTNAMIRLHVRAKVIGAKIRGENLAYYRVVIPLLLRFYWQYPSFWLTVFPLFFVPSFVMRVTRAAYRLTIKPLRLKKMAETWHPAP